MFYEDKGNNKLLTVQGIYKFILTEILTLSGGSFPGHYVHDKELLVSLSHVASIPVSYLSLF